MKRERTICPFSFLSTEKDRELLTQFPAPVLLRPDAFRGRGYAVTGTNDHLTILAHGHGNPDGMPLHIFSPPLPKVVPYTDMTKSGEEVTSPFSVYSKRHSLSRKGYEHGVI